MYEHFEHTADLGLRIRAATLEELFAEAGLALTAALAGRLDSIRPAEPRSINLEAADPADLLHDWLSELLYLFDTERMLFSRFEVSLPSGRLTATAWGETADPARHDIALEIKAITYHGLKLGPTPDGWLAEVIVDL
ncbi:MAG: archease [Thermoguttaceae bacterium]|jgi:SHS2 domain-containing protein|nr:archease [Thermoguttaceae bacterium]